MSFIVVVFTFLFLGVFFVIDLQVLVTSIIPDLEFVIVIHLRFYFDIFMKCESWILHLSQECT